MNNQKEHYICKECGFVYEEKLWVEKCEAWCKEHHSCNLEIISHGKPPKADRNNPTNHEQ